LRAYAWPGNVRELAAVIDRAAILGQGRCLEITKALGPLVAEPAIAGPLATLEAVVKHHLETVLRACEGRIEGPHGAAQTLDLHPATLRSKLRKLRIVADTFR
jgi:transcriptional regulator of acetoin/glycerol metabolism